MSTQREELERRSRVQAETFRTLRAPEPLSAGAMVALEALLQYTRTSLAELDAWHREMFREYRDELERYFRRYAQPGRRLDPDDETVPPDVWALAAMQDAVPQDLADSFVELSDALFVEDTEAIEGWLDDAMVEGSQREMWLLAMGGLDIDPYRDVLPPEEERSLLLQALGVAGVSWLARRALWGRTVTQQVTQWVRGSITGGRTLDETLAGYDRLTDRFTGGVKALVENEMVRASDTGGQVVLAMAQRDHALAEVWVTRADRLVCGICAPRHMKVTTLQPVTDSHPACRCRKVPVPVDYVYTDVDYDDLFERAFGGT